MIWLILACTSQREPSVAPESVNYSGYIMATPEAETETFVEGTVSFTLEDQRVIFASQPDPENYPGYWSATLPAGAAYDLLITGPNTYPTRWAGQAPHNHGNWFTGALFAADHTAIDTLLTTIAPQAPGPKNGATLLWGFPWDAENWDCAAVRVQEKPVSCYNSNEDGSLSPITEGPFEWFFATDLSDGPVFVDSGLNGTYLYPAQPGEVILAGWFLGE